MKKLLFILLCILAGVQTTKAQEAYACYTSSNATLTFYYDNLSGTRTGPTYSLNTDGTDTGWETAGVNVDVTQVVFDSSFANARPTTTYAWFYNMQDLQSITGMEYLNTSEVTSMRWMFGWCSALNSLDLSHFNTAKVTNMSCMFYGCTGLTSLDLCSFNTAKVTDMQQMFYGCSNLTTIYVGDGWKTTAVQSSNYMFTDCTNLVGCNGTTYNSYQVVGKGYAHIDGGESNPGYLSPEREAYAEYNADNATLTFYYDLQRSTRTGTTYGLKTSEPGWYSDNTKASVTQVVFHSSFADARPTDCYGWFRDMENLTSITGMEYLNTSDVTSMWLMFYNCKLLTSIDVSHFNTANVKNMNGMFSGCSNLTKLDLSRFNTANVTDMRYMFEGCSGLTSLDLSSFNTSKVKYMGEMFRDCSDLSIIYVDDGWSTDALTIGDLTAIRNLFLNCTKLVGGSGTRYDGNHTYSGYAHIDGGPNNPGYLTQVGEAYAVYTSSNSTLTFYYDKLRSTREDTYGMNTNPPGWWRISGSITSVVFDSSFANARPTTCFGWFRNLGNLTSITGLNYLNTTDVTCMGAMFLNCTSLTSLDLSRFNTSKVTEMYNMFNGCSNLTTIYGGYGWNTAAVTASDGMFLGCTQLVGGNGTNYDASHVDAAYACIDGGTDNPGYFTEKFEAYAVYTADNTTLTFYYDPLRITRTGAVYDLNTETNNPGWYTNRTNITSVVFNSSFADARPTTCYGWFQDMGNLTSITGLNYLNTTNVDYMYHMFENCSKLTRLDLSTFNTAKVYFMGFMFYGCSGLTNLDLSSFNTDKVRGMDYMFSNCSGLNSLDLSSFNTAKVWSMGGMFEDCSNLRTIYVGDGWSTAAVTSSGNMFSGCTKLVGGNGTTYNAAHVDVAYAHIDGNGGPGYFTEKPSEAYAVYTADNSTLTFYYDKLRRTRTGTTYELKTTAPGWYTDNTYTSVTQVVFDSSFADARPTSCYCWFCGMRSLTSITGMEYLNTSEVTDMTAMFYDCYRLTSLDLSHFNTANVTSMRSMFYDCTGLTSLDLSHFNTANVTNMYAMFAYCGLTSLDLSHFNTANVTNMYAMFAHCYLTRLNLSSFNTANVTNMQYMFYDCSFLTTIHVGDNWSTEAVTASDHMFYGCTQLVGGKGTTYDANYVDAAYAHIDDGTGNPGYFTDRPEAYAVYNENNATLTFYYDHLRNIRGATYGLNKGENEPAWFDNTSATVTHVVFDSSFAYAHPTTCYCWFYGMENLTSITGMEYLNTVYVNDMAGMFFGCTSLSSLDLSSFNTANVLRMTGMFYGCAGLTSLDLSNFNTANVLNMRIMFSGCSNLTTIHVGDGWSTAAIDVEWSEDMFYECTSLVGGKGTTFDANYVDAAYAHIDGGISNPGYFTSEPEAYAVYNENNATLTFYCDNLRGDRTTGMIYDLNEGEHEPDWLTDETCTSVTHVVFDSSFTNAHPTTCYCWFYGMENLTSITGMEYLNTANVTNMAGMFDLCTSLTSINVSHFNTANVTNMAGMFYGCAGLTSLDLSSFNTAHVFGMHYMFLDCTSLTRLDLSSFNTANVQSMDDMFGDCSNLATIYVGDGWSTDGVDTTDRMFYGCTSLVGGNGTVYDTNHVDAAYAHIDGGQSNPGYFTEKPSFIPGDANGDRAVSVADAVAVVAYLLNPSAANINLDAADVDGVEGVTIDDVQAIVNMILNKTE